MTIKAVTKVARLAVLLLESGSLTDRAVAIRLLKQILEKAND